MKAMGWMKETVHYTSDQRSVFSIKHHSFSILHRSEYVVVFILMRLVACSNRKWNYVWVNGFSFQAWGAMNMFLIATVREWNDMRCYRMPVSLSSKCVNSFTIRLAFLFTHHSLEETHPLHFTDRCRYTKIISYFITKYKYSL